MFADAIPKTFPTIATSSLLSSTYEGPTTWFKSSNFSEQILVVLVCCSQRRDILRLHNEGHCLFLKKRKQKYLEVSWLIFHQPKDTNDIFLSTIPSLLQKTCFPMQCIVFNIIHTDYALFRLWINEYIGLHSSGPNFKLVEGKAPTSIFDAFLRYRK